MSHSRFRLSACALAAAAFLVACGGGGTTPDTTAPTVTITDNISGTATSSVTFSFTFNEAVTGFTADDVSVNNGTKGAFTMATDGLSATLVVTPPSTGSGFIEVSVAAGAFADASNNANTAAVNASQAFGAPAPAAFISFDEEPGITGELQAYGGALPDLVTSPSGGSGKTLKITKPAGSENQVWGGSFFTVPSVPFTASKKAITARVYSTVPNAVILMKVEQPNGTNPCDACTEVAGTTVTEANTWTTVTWNFSSAVLTRDHTVLAITPDPTRALDGATYYIDEINVVDTPVASSPSAAAENPTAANLVTLFSEASGYTALPNGTFSTAWSSATFAEETVASNSVLKYSALDFVGIEPANPIDISTATHVNMDIWTPDLTKFRVKLVNFLDGNWDEATNKEHEITLTLDDTQRSTWYRVRIPMADFTGLTERTHVKQLILSVGDGVKGTVYVDNIFFSTN